MEKLSHPLFIAFIIAWIIEFYLFGMQRASLKISRHNNVSWKGIGENLLPNWFPITWLFSIAKYGLIVAMFFIFNWKIALATLVLSFIISTIIPIPYRLLYSKIFRNKVKKISETDFETGTFYSQMLDNTNFY